MHQGGFGCLMHPGQSPGGDWRKSCQQTPLERLRKNPSLPSEEPLEILLSPSTSRGPRAPGPFGKEKSTINFFLGNWGPRGNALWHALASSPFVFLQSCIPAARLSYRQIANPPGNPPARLPRRLQPSLRFSLCRKGMHLAGLTPMWSPERPCILGLRETEAAV